MSHAIADRRKAETKRKPDGSLFGQVLGTHMANVIICIRIVWAIATFTPCRGCFGCWQRMDGHCVIQDDQNAILDLYRTADVIIWSFPLYCYAMPSQLKAVLDRTIPLVKMDMRQEADGTVRHEALADFSKTRTVVICGCGFPNWDGNFDGLKKMCDVCFCGPRMDHRGGLQDVPTGPGRSGIDIFRYVTGNNHDPIIDGLKVRRVS